MMTLELDQHPELAALVAAIRQGEAVAVVDHGRPVMRCVPPPMALRDRLMALHRRFTSVQLIPVAKSWTCGGNRRGEVVPGLVSAGRGIRAGEIQSASYGLAGQCFRGRCQ